MKPVVVISTFIVLALALVMCLRLAADPFPPDDEEGDKTMKLGAFSLSLAVKDLATSHAFYKKLGFKQVGGGAQHGWLILQNGTSTIGLFKGMFDENIMTFNPGWTDKQKVLEEFDDVRDIQAALESQGVKIKTRADVDSKGPASIVVVDPDGNAILIDQHVPRPDK